MTVSAVWDRARPYIEAALEHAHGTHTVEDVQAAIGAGQLQLWVGERSAAVTEFFNYPRRRALNIFLAGGDLREMKACEPGMAAFARAHGCHFMQCFGRLSRRERQRSTFARAADWSAEWVVMTKDLT